MSNELEQKLREYEEEEDKPRHHKTIMVSPKTEKAIEVLMKLYDELRKRSSLGIPTGKVTMSDIIEHAVNKELTTLIDKLKSEGKNLREQERS